MISRVDCEPVPRFIEAIPHRFAREHLVLALNNEEHTALLCAQRTPRWIPLNIFTELGQILAVEEVSDEASLAELIDAAYKDNTTALINTSDTAHVNEDDGDTDLLAMAAKGDAALFVDSTLFNASVRGASDVHIQPTAAAALVRVRIDGVLITTQEIPSNFAAGVVGRIKVLADLDIAERRVAQDGRAAVTIGRRSEQARLIDLRISTLPTSHGERVVIRLLDTARDEGLQSFHTLGMPEHVSNALKQIGSASHGLTMVTGPTGSGKSTTLYATLRWIAAHRSILNIMTIEDPIECDLSAPGVAVSQSQVSRKKGVTFASGLRHILRQDPDVVMIGEVRDEETARIAVQASLTGHLVFSTLHTNDASSAITRLIDLSVEPYLVGASLSSVLAQRLVRRLHQDCKGKGCSGCFDTGYRGRVGIFELLHIDRSVRELIHDNSGHHAIREHAISHGMKTLHQIGDEIVGSGLTSYEEIQRVVCGFE